MTSDSTDKVGTTMGLIVSTAASLITDGLLDVIRDIGWHFVLGAVGALAGLIVSRLWKKHVDK